MNTLATLQATPGVSGALRLIVFVLLAVAGYYIYRYFFSSNAITFTRLVGGVTDAKKEIKAVPADALPALYEGGEYSMSCWVYVNDWAYRRGQQKHVFEIGGNNFITLMVGLGNFRNKLMVRVHSAAGSTGAGSLPTGATHTAMDAMGSESSLMDNDMPICDLPELDMQRWVLVTVVITGRICDVYLDGKLARSCTLPSFFRVDNGYSVKALMNGGFGGFISNLTAYGYALNPSDVYKMYMNGPKAGGGFLDWFTSFFTPNVTNFYPKMNGQ
jgi:phosphatidylglycerophosphate synthase